MYDIIPVHSVVHFSPVYFLFVVDKRMQTVYSFQLVPHIREELHRVLEEKERKNICELQLSKKKKNSLAGLICEA